MLELERDLVFRMYDFHDLTKDQLRERTMEKVRIGCGNVTKHVAKGESTNHTYRSSVTYLTT